MLPSTMSWTWLYPPLNFLSYKSRRVELWEDWRTEQPLHLDRIPASYASWQQSVKQKITGQGIMPPNNDVQAVWDSRPMQAHDAVICAVGSVTLTVAT